MGPGKIGCIGHSLLFLFGNPLPHGCMADTSCMQLVNYVFCMKIWASTCKTHPKGQVAKKPNVQLWLPFATVWFHAPPNLGCPEASVLPGTRRETNTRCARCYARCARFGARCFIKPPFFHLVTVGCKHHSPTTRSRACGRAAGSKICDHPPPSARGGTPGDRRP